MVTQPGRPAGNLEPTMARIIRNETYIGESMRVTDADRVRMAAGIAKAERERAARAKERIARLAYCCAIVALGIALFYSATGTV